MKRSRFLIGLFLLLPFCAVAQDHYSNWFEVDVNKELGKQWDLNAGAELRTNYKARYSFSLGAEYKPVKFLKLGLGYTFIEREGTTEDHYTANGIWDGFNRTSSWVRNHRGTFDVTGSVKLWKWLRVSLRERYQFTYRPEQTVEQRKVRYDVYDLGGGQYDVDMDNPDISDRDDKVKDALYNHVLRSRLKLEIDKKKWRFAPFIAGELHNNLTNNMLIEKVRAMAGTEYKFDKHHSISAAYVLNIDLHDDDAASFDDINERLHAFNLSYCYKF